MAHPMSSPLSSALKMRVSPAWGKVCCCCLAVVVVVVAAAAAVVLVVPVVCV